MEIFRVSFKTLSADASVDQLNEHIFREVGDKVAVQTGGAVLQTFIFHFCGIKKKSNVTMASGMADDEVWTFVTDPDTLLVTYPEENTPRYMPKPRGGQQQQAAGGVRSTVFKASEFYPKYEIPANYQMRDWDSETRKLDRMMYAAFLSTLKGAPYATASDTGGEMPCVLAVCKLHYEYNRSELPQTLKVLHDAMDPKFKGLS